MMNEEINIEDCVGQIRKMASVAHQKMRKPSPYSFEDMVSEGFVVLLKDVLPNYIRNGNAGHKANFKSYLTVCLRNHYIGMMKQSFRSGKADAKYTEQRIEESIVPSPLDIITSNSVVANLNKRITDEEREYLLLVVGGHTRKEARNKLGISLFIESRMRNSIQHKFLEIDR